MKSCRIMRYHFGVIGVAFVLFFGLHSIFFSCTDDGNDDPAPTSTPTATSTVTPTTAPAADIRGTWSYIQSSNTGTYDQGTITFSGSTSSGSYSGFNYYEYEFSGNYTVHGNDVTLTGDKEWTGAFDDSTHMSGTWYYDSELCTWTAEKGS
ncbi:hypothetical protein ACFL27_25155 [candidate division CSSED10-310 bacterium]|uniref:Lipocalin-like domain-containing protein n=1 Tax=candidate division CSSED10-310 bacterium TaxID=2855610 RepID=A0ABV6Z4X0_UNCC1